MFALKHRILKSEVNRFTLNFVMRKNKQHFFKPARGVLLDNIHHLHCLTEFAVSFAGAIATFYACQNKPKN